MSLDFGIDNIIYAFGVAEFESGYRNAPRVEKEIRWLKECPTNDTLQNLNGKIPSDNNRPIKLNEKIST